MTMPNAKHLWISRTDDNHWKVRREGADRASSMHDTQRAAFEAARRTARRERGEVFIKGTNGQLRDRDSFGNDPSSRRDARH